MIRKSALFLLALLFTPALASAQQASFTGYWYGSDTQQKPGYLTQWIGHYRDDGSFVINYQSLLQCALMTRTLQEGRWSLDGNIQTNQLQYADGRANNAVGRYEILEMTPDFRRYRSLRTNITYEAKRVDESFTFPACGAAS